MRYSFAIGSLALAAGNAMAAPQGVTSAIAPQASAPAGCSPSYSGKFQITVVNTTSSHAKRDALELTLSGGVLKDAQGRTGYVASNYQFQFDGPPQAGAIYTSGFSMCSNGSLALGGSTVWYQCLSGGFYNLYDRPWAPQCSPIYIENLSAPAPVTQASDGQPVGTTVVTSVSQRTDGQPIATTAVSQRTDGQVIASTSQVTPVAPVSQISDGQIQNPKSATTGPAVSQMSDGQVYATPVSSKVAVSQISDGQIQASPVKSMAPATGAPVSQMTDGQVYATSATSATSAAPKATSSAPASAPVSQKTDGQVVATPTKAAANNTVTAASSKPSQVTVNGAPAYAQFAGSAVFAGLVVVVAAVL